MIELQSRCLDYEKVAKQYKLSNGKATGDLYAKHVGKMRFDGDFAKACGASNKLCEDRECLITPGRVSRCCAVQVASSYDEGCKECDSPCAVVRGLAEVLG